MWQSPDGEWFEWFWSFKTEQKVFEKFFGAEYNFQKPLKLLKLLTTIGKHQWGMRETASEWFFGLCKWQSWALFKLYISILHNNTK